RNKKMRRMKGKNGLGGKGTQVYSRPVRPIPLNRPSFARPPSPTRGEGGRGNAAPANLRYWNWRGYLCSPFLAPWERIGSPGEAKPNRRANLVRGNRPRRMRGAGPDASAFSLARHSRLVY